MGVAQNYSSSQFDSTAEIVVGAECGLQRLWHDRKTKRKFFFLREFISFALFPFVHHWALKQQKARAKTTKQQQQNAN